MLSFKWFKVCLWLPGLIGNSTPQTQEPAVGEEKAVIVTGLFVAAAETETIPLLQDQKLAE